MNISLKDQNDKQFSVKVSFLEIYKEELKDLLDSSDKDMHIREDECGNISKQPCLTFLKEN